MGFCSLRFDLQKTEYTERYGAKNACFARILTYCATHTPAQPFATKERYGCGVPLAGIPYLCTPTGVSCLSSELFRSLSACRKGFFDTLLILDEKVHQESHVLRTLALCERTMRRLMQNLTRLWRYEKLFKLFNRFYYQYRRNRRIRSSARRSVRLTVERLTPRRLAISACRCPSK